MTILDRNPARPPVRRGLPLPGIEQLWAIMVLALIGAFIALVPTAPHDFWWHLKAGELVAIFPEGRLTDTGELNAFKAGGARIVGRVRYDPSVTRAQIQEKSVVDTDCPSADDIRGIWKELAIQ